MPSGLVAVLPFAPLTAAAAYASLPPPPIPGGNPINEPKRILGKMLFWDEQLSSDNRMSCGTCHMPSTGGSTGNRRNPGFDAAFMTADDSFGARGVVRADASNNFILDPLFALAPRVTPRNPNTTIAAVYAFESFWDGRARGSFIDPLNGQNVIPTGASLEIQALAPARNDIEMAHEGRNWSEITAKLAAARPMALATNLPTDVANALVTNPTYTQLFNAAFGPTPSGVTPTRITMAIATYERTLIPDLAPWDSFTQGQQNALSPQQQQGLITFQTIGCIGCHTPPLFTSQQFVNIGLRPPAEDMGRQLVTNIPSDRGKFKTPTLRNAGLRQRFMHNGEFTTLTDVVRFYVQAPGAAPRFTDNLDPRVNNLRLQESGIPALVDFLTNGLTDQRVAAEVFPFDRPRLWSERTEQHATPVGGGRAGPSGVIPSIVVLDPPMAGNADFRIGVTGGFPGGQARMVITRTPPTGPIVVGGTVSDAVTLSSAGHGTFHHPIDDSAANENRTFYAQWIIDDPNVPGRTAFSDIASFTVFCPRGGCAPGCPGDFDLNGFVNPDDLADFITCFFLDVQAPGSCLDADFNHDGFRNPDDLADFITGFFTPCAS